MWLKVFAVDVLACPQCQWRMQRIAWIAQPSVINAILDCLEVKSPTAVESMKKPKTWNAIQFRSLWAAEALTFA